MVYGTYTLLCGANLDEMQGHLRDYRSLQDFFQRPLVAGRRPVDRDSSVVWPNDGLVLSAGIAIDTGEVREKIQGLI